MASNAPPAPGSQHSARFISPLFILCLHLLILLTCCFFFHFPLSLCTTAPPSSFSSPDILLCSCSHEADPLPAPLSVSGSSAPSWPVMRSPYFARLASLAINYAVSCSPRVGAVTRTAQVQICFFSSRVPRTAETKKKQC